MCECGHEALYHYNLKKHWYNKDRAETFGACAHKILNPIDDDCSPDYCKHVWIGCKCDKFKYPQRV